MARGKSRRRADRANEHPELDVTRLVAGRRRTESRGGHDWNVQPLAEHQAVKFYVCPGCGRDIEPETAHLVVWRADGVMGDAADLEARRHWHSACWRLDGP